MNIRAIFFVAACNLLQSQAGALTLNQIDYARASGDLLEVTVVGEAPAVEERFIAACQSGTLDVYLNSKALFTGETADGGVAKTYSCTTARFVSSNTGYGVKVLLHRLALSNAVFPVAKNVMLPFLNVGSATCNQDTKVCSAIVQKRPDGGLAPVSLSGFNAAANRSIYPYDFSSSSIVANTDFQEGAIVFQTIMGLAVSNELYVSLQIDQGTTGRPSVPRTVIASMLSNSYNPELGWVPLFRNAANISGKNQINICRYVNGSGIQAAANRFWLEYGVNASALIPADNANNSNFANDFSNARPDTDLIMVYEGATASKVRDCLSKASDNGAFAIGHLSLEEGSVGKWKFVSIDGVEPSRDNAKRGVYPYFFSSPGLVAKTGNSSAGRAYVADLFRALQSPDGLTRLSPAVQSGLMTMPGAYGCPASLGVDFYYVESNSPGATRADKFCSRSQRFNMDELFVFDR